MEEETMKNLRMCRSGVFARADMTSARAHNILEGSAQADMTPLSGNVRSSEPEAELGVTFDQSKE